jgi:hypothetical protein
VLDARAVEADMERQKLEAKVRAPRLTTSRAVEVDSRTLGAPLRYRLTTANISRTGLLLDVDCVGRVPFRVNTLVELVVDPQGRVFEKPVACVGKVVSVGRQGDGAPRFGVHIVQLDGRDRCAWEAALALLEAAQASAAEALAAPAAAA